MRTLVTGAEGFVGPHLARELAAGGREVVRAARAPDLDVALDVTSPEACVQAVRVARPDAVVHLAGVSSPVDDPRRTWAVNATGTVNLLEAVAREAPRARVLVVSSAYVYGRVPDADQPIREARAPAPVNAYGASKAAAEAAASSYAAQGLDVVVVRPFNHVGPGQSTAFFVPALVDQVARRRKGIATGPVEVGNLDPVRDLLDVRDVVAAYALVLDKAASGDVLNVASGHGASMAEVVDLVREVAGPFEVAPAAGRARAVEIPRLVGDATRLRSLGWTPRHPLAATLRDVLAERELRN